MFIKVLKEAKHRTAPYIEDSPNVFRAPASAMEREYLIEHEIWQTGGHSDWYLLTFQLTVVSSPKARKPANSTTVSTPQRSVRTLLKTTVF